MNKKEKLILWAINALKEIGNHPWVTIVNASANTGWWHRLSAIKPNDEICPNLYLKSWKFLSSPIIPLSELNIHEDGKKNRWVSRDHTTGAYQFNFEYKGIPWSAVYMLFEYGSNFRWMALAALPKERFREWALFEAYLESRWTTLKAGKKTAYIFGSAYDKTFKPTVTLQDVILPENIKEEVTLNIDTFFKNGIELYKRMKVPAFRKLLLYGTPGNGKTYLAQALAHDQLRKNRAVVYVSSSDEHGPDFHKLQRALCIARDLKMAILIVIEELDSYVTDPSMRAQILDVLDGFEAPDNPAGTVLLMTTNYPERLDDAVLRFGRVDMRWKIPPIVDVQDAHKLLKQYLCDQYDQHEMVDICKRLVSKPRVFVRELVFNTRMQAAASGDGDITKHIRPVLKSLEQQLTSGELFLKERRASTSPMGFHQFADDAGIF